MGNEVPALTNIIFKPLNFMVCRPGRLEVQVEISLPDENGRLQILQIHTNKMKENSFISPDVNLQELGMFTHTVILIGIICLKVKLWFMKENIKYWTASNTNMLAKYGKKHFFLTFFCVWVVGMWKGCSRVE